ncbi:MAG: DUF423 domain-containing protein [Alphaproteobacteria bacterium]
MTGTAVRGAAMMGGVSGWMICFAGLSGATAVLIAAATAHEPLAFLIDADLARIQTAVRYQIWHALALLATAAILSWRPDGLLVVAAIAFGVGSLLFCGGLYLLAFTGPTSVTWIVPMGGLAFATGWLVLALQGLRIVFAGRA